MGLATADVVQVSYEMSLYGQRLLTVLHVAVKTPDPATTLMADLQAIAEWYGDDVTAGRPLTTYKACVTEDLLFTGVRAQRVKPTRSIYYMDRINVYGTQALPAGAANIAASIIKRTLQPGRTGIGRVQVPGIPQSKYQAGMITDAPYLLLLQGFANTMVATQTIAAPLTVHPVLPGGGIDLDYEIFQAYPMDTVRIMRRRTVGVGE